LGKRKKIIGIYGILIILIFSTLLALGTFIFGYSIGRFWVKLPTKMPTKETHAPQPKTLTSLFTIQVLSTKDRVEAEIFIRKLQKEGIDAHLREADLGDRGVWYRVRVGRFKTESEATQKALQMKKDGLIDSYWVVKERRI
jgi:hypothetical protein